MSAMETSALETLERVANRWTVLVLAALQHSGTLRYKQIQAAVEGITERTLTQCLRRLEQHGLVLRKRYPIFPPRVEYRLTDLGFDLIGQLRGVHAWIHLHRPSMLAAYERFDHARGPGRGI